MFHLVTGQVAGKDVRAQVVAEVQSSGTGNNNNNSKFSHWVSCCPALNIQCPLPYQELYISISIAMYEELYVKCGYA
jgi:hypothetical protein